MQILSSAEGYLLERRFARGLKLALALVALAACAITWYSVEADRRDTERRAQQGDRDMSTALRAHVDNLMDQSYYSLAGIAEDLRAAGSAGRFLGPPALAALRAAMRFDPATRYLYVRAAGQLLAVDQAGARAPAALEAALAALPPPERADRSTLAGPITVDGGESVVPMQLQVGGMPGDGVVLGALIPVARLGETHLRLGQRSTSGQALYLTDGRVLMRSVNQPRFLGGMAPESAAIAAAAAGQPDGAFEATATTGARLIGQYQRSERHPFIAGSGQVADVYLAPWRERSLLRVAFLALLLVLLAVAARVLLAMLRTLAASEGIHRRLFEEVAEGVFFYTGDGRVVAVNQAALRLLAASSAEDVVGRNLFEILPRPRDPQTGRPSMLAQQRTERALAGERLQFEDSYEMARTRQQLDCVVHLSALEVGGQKLVVAIVRDVTAERRHVRQQEFLANRDPLTGLPNRHNLMRTLDRHIDGSPGQPLLLVVVNLLRFKEINDGFGHRSGDTVLEVAAHRLARALAERGWLLARLGGADLVALCHGPAAAAADAAAQAAAVVAWLLAEPIAVADTTVELRATLGAARYPDDALDSGQLLRCAEAAMTQARQQLQPFAHYDRTLERMPPGHERRLRAELTEAIREGQLSLAYQPKLWLESRDIAGVEALLRWQHPQQGWIAPGAFIPLAETTELIHPLTRWVIGEAIEQILRWCQQGRPTRIAVNISANNLQDPDFVDYVKDLLGRRKVAPELLELELTEGALARNPEIVLRRLQDLRSAGLGLALDDFGTGYSSLSYVSQFPFSALKIDRSFVQALLSGVRERQVAESTVTLGRKLELQTVAEGVEDDATAAALLALECDIGQGYLFARPMLLAEVEAWRAAHEARQTAALQQAARSLGN